MQIGRQQEQATGVMAESWGEHGTFREDKWVSQAGAQELRMCRRVCSKTKYGQELGVRGKGQTLG